MTTCVICQRREVEHGQVCTGDRAGTAAALRDLVDAHAALSAPLSDETGETLPAGPVRAAGGSAPVSGSRQAPIPVSLDVLDLTAAARLPNPPRGPGGYPRSWWPEDQIGHLPVATVLDQWVRDWITYPWCPGDHLPVPTVPVLAGWLSDRLQLACDRHPAVDDFAAEVRQLLFRCRAAAGDLPARPEVLVGVPCSSPDCDGLLLHQPGDTYWAECVSCGRLFTEAEYRSWVELCAAPLKTKVA